MPAPICPLEVYSIPNEIQRELNRRKKNVGLNFVKPDGWNKDGGDWENYKGPMTSWVRVCSNGNGKPSLKKPGFILNGGKGFYQGYGFHKGTSGGNEQTIGYTPTGVKHIIEYDKNTSDYPIHVPPPEITKLNVGIQADVLRRAVISWTCFSAKQLDYLTPYFLTIGKTSCIVEFGWNHFNPASLLDLTNEEELYNYFFKNPYPLWDKILQSNGNYDVIMGLVTSFEWSLDGNKINCTTEIMSDQRLYAGLPLSVALAQYETPSTETIKAGSITATIPAKAPTRTTVNLEALASSTFSVENIKDMIAISTSKTLQEAEKIANPRFVSLINNFNIKEEYWRGIFFGRDGQGKMLQDSKGNLDYQLTLGKKMDFDYTPYADDNFWLNMGFIVEVLNCSIPLSIKDKELFFKVDVDQAVIGAHPNLISNNGEILLIPNAFAPKYAYGVQGQKTNKGNGDYENQFITSPKQINKKVPSETETLWYADKQLSDTCKQGAFCYRDNLDEVINCIRYMYGPGKGKTFLKQYSFPFVMEEKIKLKNSDKEVVYKPYFYGYFKDLYFNVKHLSSLLARSDVKTYIDLYNAIFDSINSAVGNYWEFGIMTNEFTGKMTVVDKKMLPSGNNNKTKPFYFDYMDSNSLLLNLGFKPKPSDLVANKALWGENNNKNSKVVMQTENDIMDMVYEDRLLHKYKDKAAPITPSEENSKNIKNNQLKFLQSAEPFSSAKGSSVYQFTITVNEKPYFRRLVLPNPEFQRSLLDDKDYKNNQTYIGAQPLTIEIGIQGIGGIRTFCAFLIRNIPIPYHHKDVCYQVKDVQHILTDGKWETTIRAGVVPLRGLIKSKLGIDDE